MFKILENANYGSEFTILMKATHGCNLDCQYCYDKPFRDKFGSSVVSYETIEKLLKLASKHTNHLSWVWHGGEPTILGVEWYEKVQELFYKYSNMTIVQRMQTNGVLLDERWAEFSNTYDVSIGVSYDALGQDVRLNGKNYNVEESLERFVKAGGKYNTISVINKTNFRKMTELYEFVKEKKIQTSFNPVYKSKGSVEYDLGLTAREFADEFLNFFKYYMFDSTKDATYERMNEIMMSKVVGDERIQVCNFTDCRMSWLGVNPNGDIYPCDRHTSDDYRFGNIHDFDSISEIYAKSIGFKNLTKDTEKRLNTHCQECGYIKYCQGGCTATHVASTGTATEVDDFTCDIFKYEFNGIYEILRDLDIYDNSKKLNKNFISRIIESPVFPLKEILEFLRGKGIPENLLELRYDGDGKKLLDCQEFRLFRVFNQYKGLDVFNKSSSYFNVKNRYNATVDERFDFAKIKEQRLESLEDLWSNQKNVILSVLMDKD